MAYLIKNEMISYFLNNDISLTDGVTTNVKVDGILHLDIVTYPSQENYENGAMIAFIKKPFIDFAVSCGEAGAMTAEMISNKYGNQIPSELTTSIVNAFANEYDNLIIVPNGISIAITAEPYASVYDLMSSATKSTLGAVLNDPINNSAIGPFSVAAGHGTIAGIKGYYYCNIVISDDKKTASITLTDNQDEVNNLVSVNYSVGDIISIVNGSKYPDCATITGISDNVITVDIITNFGALKSVSDPSMDDLSLYVYNKPNDGIINLGWYSHAEGENTQALERASHAEGRDTKAKGQYSHVEGRETEAAYCGHAEGRKSKATNEYTHAEGSGTIASGKTSHAEGASTQSIGNYSHSEGESTKAQGSRSHAEGWKSETSTDATAAHAEGYDTRANGLYSHSEGRGCKATGESSHAEGHYTIAGSKYQHVQGMYNVEDTDGKYAHVVGWGTSSARKNIHTLTTGGDAWFAGNVTVGASQSILATQSYVTNSINNGIGRKGSVSSAERFNDYNNNVASADFSHAEGYNTTASKHSAHAEGKGSTASGTVSHAEGNGTTASGSYSHSEGQGTVASGGNSHAEGFQTQANEHSAHAEGLSTIADGKYSHAEGNGSHTQGGNSHAEGHNTLSVGESSHAEGILSKSGGKGSHAEGHSTEANGTYSHAEGIDSVAKSEASHAEGIGTIAATAYQHVQGMYNVEDTDGKYAHVVGWGTSSARKNIHTLTTDGDAWFAGTVEATAVILKSSTSGSTKRFKVTVDDNGTISAVEIQ